MTSTYNDLADVSVGDNLTKEFINYLIHNIDFLRNPPIYIYTRSTAGGDYTTTSAIMGDIDGTNMSINFTSQGGPVLIALYGRADNAAFDLYVDGANLAADTTGLGQGDAESGICVQRILELTAGVHTISAQWRAFTGTATLYDNSYIQFVVREL